MNGNKLRKALTSAGKTPVVQGSGRGVAVTTTADNNKLFGLSSDFPIVMELDVVRVHRDPEQPRKIFREDEMESLTRSVKEKGLYQPILVRPHPDKGPGEYMLVFGERRWRAHVRAEKPTIIAIVHPNPNVAEAQLIENDQRQDLTPVERGRGYRRLMEEHGYSQRELGRIVGLSQPEINRYLALLALPSAILDEYESNPELIDRVSKSLLAEISAEPDVALQLELWELAKAGTTVRALRERKFMPSDPTSDQEGGKAEGDPTSDRSQEARSQSLSDPTRVLASFTRSIGKVARHVEQLRAAGTPLDDDTRKHLQEVRRRIDEMLVETGTQGGGE